MKVVLLFGFFFNGGRICRKIQARLFLHTGMIEIDVCCFNIYNSEVWFQLFHSILKVLNFRFYRKPDKNKTCCFYLLYFFNGKKYQNANTDQNFPTCSFSKVEAKLKKFYKEFKFKEHFFNSKLPYALSYKQIHNWWANLSFKSNNCWLGISQIDLDDLGFNLFARYWDKSLLTPLEVQACLFINRYSISHKTSWHVPP